MEQYLLFTKDMSMRQFKIGQTLYGKITEGIYTNQNKVYFYDKYADPNIVSPYGVINGTIRNSRDYIVTELLKQKFKSGQRALFSVVALMNDIAVVIFDSIEDDEQEISHAFSYNKIREHNGLYYIEQSMGLTVVGFSNANAKVIIPSSINNKLVIAIGNYNEFGMPINIIDNYNCHRDVYIEDGIKIIDDYAFKGQFIKNIVLPNTLQHIGKFSFSEANIEKIDLSNTKIDIIEDYCFSLSLIKDIILPDKMYVLKRSCFYNSNIENIIMPIELEQIEINAFKNCLIDKISNNCKVDYMDIGNDIILNNDNNIFIKCLKLKDFEDLNVKLIGYFTMKDIEEDKIAEVAYGSDYEEIEVEKIIYYLEDDKQKKYEAVLCKYDEQDFDDEELSYKNYIRSIKFDLYIVEDFKLDRYFEYFDENDFFKTFKFVKNDIYDNIKIKYNDIGKISGLAFSSEYKYLFDDLVIGKNHGQEFKPSKDFVYYLIENVDFKNDIKYNDIKKEEKRYKLFKGIKE